MKAEIICVGTELLLGDILNTNAQFISQQLSALGISVYNQQVVGDNPQRLKEAAQLAKERSDIVIYSGGLGPTDDDLTKQTVARVYNDTLVFNEKVCRGIQEYFAKTGRVMTDNNKKQAYVPVKGKYLENDYGTAPGIIFIDGEKLAVLMPGVPREMIPMMKNQVVPLLKKLVKGVILSRYVHVIGIGESALEEKISLLLNGENPTMALYAKEGEVLVRITALAHDSQTANDMLDKLYEKLDRQIHDYIYGVDVKNIETVLIEKLLANGQTVATAESCTGGSISARLTSVSGASGAFSLGVCAYSESQKHEILGVSEESLETYTAVSSQVACEMAKGILEKSGADYAISTTGYAGPGGGTPQEPVGTVYMAVATKESIFVKKCFFAGDRERITHLARQSALDLLRCVMFSLPCQGVKVIYNDELLTETEDFDDEEENKKKPGFLKTFFTLLLLLILALGMALGYLYIKNDGDIPLPKFNLSALAGVFGEEIDIDTLLNDRQNEDFFRQGFERDTLKILSRLSAQNQNVSGWLTFKNTAREYPIFSSSDNADEKSIYFLSDGSISDYIYISGFTGDNFPEFTDIDEMRLNSSFVLFQNDNYTDYQIFSVGTFSGEDLSNLTKIENARDYIVQIRARSLFDVDVVVKDSDKLLILLQKLEDDKYVAVFAIQGNRNIFPSVDIKTMTVYSDWYMRENNLTDELVSDALLYAQEVYDRDNWYSLSVDQMLGSSSQSSSSDTSSTSSKVYSSSYSNIVSSNVGGNSSQIVSASSQKTDSSRQAALSSSSSQSSVTSSSQAVSSSSQTQPPVLPDDSGEETLTVTMNGQVVSGPATQILSQIVAIEMSSSWNVEALKAQAVATHTYLEYQYANGVAAPAVSGRSNPGRKVVDAVSQVSDLIMTVNGVAVYTPYCASAAGYTNPAGQVWGTNHSHLQTVESKYDYLSSGYEKTYVFSVGEMKEILESRLGITLDEEDAENWFTVIDYTDGGYVRRMQIGSATTYVSKSGNVRNITGNWFATDIMADAGKPLRSAAFTYSYRDGYFTFVTKGYGHGVGMSQWGAQLYAAYEGWDYRQILNHYYNGVIIQSK